MNDNSDYDLTTNEVNPLEKRTKRQNNKKM